MKGNFKRYDIPRFYHKKETFGDIDIIVSLGGFTGDMREFINATFKPNEIFHNGNAWSFDYKELQVDFITCADEDFDSNYHYLAFNDLGNFIGRLAQSVGLKYGQEGLWYNHYSDANTKTKIMVSKDYDKIFNFLGLDYDRWIEGFDTLEDIFEYAMTSRFFNAPMFQLSELNKINRERNVKRKSYMSFLEYIEGKEPNIAYNYEVVKKMRSEVTEVINHYFPEVKIDLHLLKIDYESAIKKEVANKFNGKEVMKRYGLSGKELGLAIKNFKDEVSKFSSFNNFIINTTIPRIYEKFEEVNNIK